MLYTGVTRDLIRRVYEHKTHADPNSFTAKYKTDKLVYFEETNDINAAIEREKQIKSWSRNRKTDLIFEKNPHWVDLYNRLLGERLYREIATGLKALALTAGDEARIIGGVINGT